MMAEENEHLYNYSSPCPIYYVQSPSTATTITTTSHALTHPPDSVFLSPHFPPDDTSESNVAHRQSDDTSRLVLSRYSSSRSSNNSFLHHKKGSHTDGTYKSGKRQVLTIVSRHGEDELQEDGGLRKNLFWRFVSLDATSSGCCIVFQLVWRLAVGLAFAFLIFFLATKPAKPHFSFKVGKIEHFNLGEGMDNSGVITNILDCNCSITMEIENFSKVFGLRVDSTTLEMIFAPMTFATSQGDKSYVENRSSRTITFIVSAKNKPMYAAGRDMQDLLETNQGLPIVVRAESRFIYHVIGNLIKLRYRQHAECVLFLKGLQRTRIYSSSCSAEKFHE